MKTIKKIFIIVLLFALSISGQDGSSFLTKSKINGKYWNEIEESNKNEFILGVGTGIHSSLNYLTQLKIATTDSVMSSKLDLIRKSLNESLWNSEVKIEKIRKEIDNVYSFEKYEIIPIEEVSFVILNFLSGNLSSSDKISNLEVLRKLFVNNFEE